MPRLKISSTRHQSYSLLLLKISLTYSSENEYIDISLQTDNILLREIFT